LIEKDSAYAGLAVAATLSVALAGESNDHDEAVKGTPAVLMTSASA